ncbi:hypothetical protein BN7_4145 [Wickerhamomyces ciferrii]|uniref:Sas10 C-terminal domain-containing protein n=1 Tax=Wickerhamomyces ciferrii (strain ATCC 14091 / BCRC 22168 / CBS 111 / JCM 3599 / NBRC 0793 / NRRL Y-1031 F-60-10) TaxID=1206466 RepID=K0KT82_WICCF|nr:uncharacterized protein BN7_4145 [Wickerhamomyces ciferrii]CCH44579.1 hypothetical protein BN7_4145 [Wickerhamomyces ciferrii]
MARSKGRQSKPSKVPEEDFGMTEVDAFHAAKDKLLLDDSHPIYQGNDDEDSDEEVMGVDDDSQVELSEEDEDEDDDDEQFFGKKDEDLEDLEDDDDTAWGSRKSAYYGADKLDDDEAAKLQEEEALRMQKKHLEELELDDYVDEELEEEWKNSAKKHDFGNTLPSTSEKSDSAQNFVNLDPKAKKKHIISAHPEFFPLSKELSRLKPILDELREQKDQSEVSNVKFTALSAYLGAISSYFAIFLASLKEEEPFSLKEHPVMEGILSSKEVWRQAEELEDVEDIESDDEELVDTTANNEEQLEGSDDESSDDDVFDSASEEADSIPDNEPESDLEIDISKPRNFKKVKPQATEDFAEGDIADVDAEEKKSRKRTLRFYTSKIDQQAKKKDEKYTGDLDIPYKERLFERQQRLIEEARKRGLRDDNGADLDAEGDYDSQDEKDAKEVNGGFDDDYYNTLKSNKTESKAARKEAHEQAVKAAKEGRLAELQEDLGDDGKRAINYQILKNKGLTPHRKKDNRNSRVKKRKKYEKAQKKLKSTRAVFTQPTGAYEGEKTGIKKNLSKSVKF